MLLLLFAVSLAFLAADITRKSYTRHAPFTRFVEVESSDGGTVHELVFAIQQRNLIEMDALLMERSTPGEPDYQKWLSRDEIARMSSNPEGTRAVKEWLTEHNITATWQSRNGEYIKAEAPISTWEEILSAKFSVFEETLSARGHRRSIHRTTSFSLPHHLAPHLSMVFHTTQEPPQLRRENFAPDPFMPKNPEVNIQFLKNFYRIPDCPSKPPSPHTTQLHTTQLHTTQLQQAVVETAYQRFSFADVARFQALNNLPSNPPVDLYGYNSTDCGVDTCSEGNLNLQVHLYALCVPMCEV